MQCLSVTKRLMHFSSPETRASLILRLQNADDIAAWESFESIYAPVILRVAKRLGLQSSDVDNVIQEVLMRTLDQQGLAYRVFDHHIHITTKSAASDYTGIRYYDMAYVQPNNKLTREIMLAIENSIDPDHWANNGGTGRLFSVGQLLIVRTTENYHLEIERMLAR
jgi:hypothetical protein